MESEQQAPCSAVEGTMASRCRKPFAASAGLLWRNRELAKAVAASGFLGAAAGLAENFIISVARGKIWGSDMAKYNAITGIVINIVAVVGGGPFGRFTDRVDRRVAFMVFGLLSFLPSWAFLIVGGERGLWAATAMKIVAAVGGSCNVAFALATDVTDFSDRELGAGLFFAGTNFLAIVLNGVPAILILGVQIVSAAPGWIYALQGLLSLLFFVCLASMREPPRLDAEDEDTISEGGRDSTAQSMRRRRGFRAQLREPLRLMLMHRRIRRLCLTGFLLAFSSGLVLVIASQFVNQALGLIPNGTDHDFAVVSMLNWLPGQVMILPAQLLTGYVAKQRGTLRLLRRLIPLTAACTLFGLGLAICKEIWLLPIIASVQAFSGLAMLPLMRLAAGAAPPGRLGEVLAAVGMAMQLSGLLSNLLVAVMNPVLNTRLWVYYVVAALIALLALLPVLGRPRGGWGAAAGQLQDELAAEILAKIMATRWLRTTRRSKSRAAHPSVREASRSSRSSEAVPSQPVTPDVSEDFEAAVLTPPVMQTPVKGDEGADEGADGGVER